MMQRDTNIPTETRDNDGVGRQPGDFGLQGYERGPDLVQPAPFHTAPPTPRSPGGLRGIIGAIVGALLVLGSKLKFVLVLFKFSKLGATTISMLISAALYASIFGWAYGLGFVVLLFVHEMGHVIAARYEGIDVSAPMFIPFMGAFISMKQRPENSLSEARIAAGGPILGSIGAGACLGLYFVTGQPLLLALSYIGFFLNLFNMIPMSPLDGGRILGAASKWALLAGLPVLAFFAFARFNPFLIYFLLLGALEVWNRFRAPDDGYYALRTDQRWGVVACYVLMASAISWGMSESHGMLDQVRMLQGL